MNHQKPNINALAANYQADRTEESFRAVYDEFIVGWRRRWKRDAAETLSDVAEIESLHNLELYRSLKVWEPSKGDFEHYVNHRIKRRKVDLFRQNSRRANKTRSLDELTELENDTGTPIPILDDGSPTLEHAVQKKMTDHLRQEIIDHLLGPSRTLDSVTTAIVTNLARYKSPNALAKALGIHHEVVKRKLTALRSRYDSNRFGNVRDYLAV